MAWSPLQEIVTLDQFKQHLRLPLDLATEDDALSLKLLIAHEQVFDYLTQRLDDDNLEAWTATVDAWTDATAPKRVIGAILEQAAHLYRYRGDEVTPTAAGELSPGVISLLTRFRDPAIG